MVDNIIGIDLGGTRIKIGLIKEGKIAESNILEINPNNGLKSVLPYLEKEIVQLSHANSVFVKAIGVAFPGIVNSDKSRVIDTSGKYEDASDINMKRWAKERFDLPLHMDNDARLACFGEWRYGAGKGISDLVMLTLGTGIGTAAVIGGTLLKGRHFQAGILGGHIVLDYKNKTDKCSCGKYGCAEAVASMWMIERMARRDPLFKNSRLAKEDYIDWKVILELANRGDKLSEILKEHCLRVWAVSLINMVHAYDPETVIIGGGISHAESVILPYFKKILQEKAWCPGYVPEIKVAKFPDTAALLGAAAQFE